MTPIRPGMAVVGISQLTGSELWRGDVVEVFGIETRMATVVEKNGTRHKYAVEHLREVG